MHEHSLVRSLLKQAGEIRRQHGADQIAEVRVEVGPLSGVEPLLLESAFELLVSQSSHLAAAKLVIDEVALLAKCEACNVKFEVNDFVFRCTQCGGNVTVIQGDEFHLVSVSLQFNEPAREMV